MARIGSSGNGGNGGGNSVIPELTNDPVSPTPEQTWVLHAGAAGSPIGLLLSLTYATDLYFLSYRTLEGTTVRVQLTNLTP